MSALPVSPSRPVPPRGASGDERPRSRPRFSRSRPPRTRRAAAPPSTAPPPGRSASSARISSGAASRSRPCPACRRGPPTRSRRSSRAARTRTSTTRSPRCSTGPTPPRTASATSSRARTWTGSSRRPAGSRRADLRGDLHLHTDRSDGRMPLAALHRALEARGDRYALLTDHARDCAVAGGLFPADFRAQRREVDAPERARRRDFTMFVGAEANIAEDGTLDVTPRSVPELDAVVASVHTDLRSPRDQTARLVRAIETPGVAVLGHPKGRLYDMRSGVRADWPRVFAAAAARGVAIELNGCPERLDLPPALARIAVEAGLPLLDLERRARGRAPLVPRLRPRRRAPRGRPGGPRREHVVARPLRRLARGAARGLTAVSRR